MNKDEGKFSDFGKRGAINNKEIFNLLKKKINDMPMKEVKRKLSLSGYIPFMGGRPEVRNMLTGEIIERGQTINSDDFMNLSIALGELEVNYQRIGKVVDGVKMSKDLAWSIFFQNT